MINYITCVPWGGALTNGSLAAHVQLNLPPRLCRCFPDARRAGTRLGRWTVLLSCSDATMLVDLLLAQARRAGREGGSFDPLCPLTLIPEGKI